MTFAPGQKIRLKPNEGGSYKIPKDAIITVKEAGSGWIKPDMNVGLWGADWYHGPYNPDCFESAEWPVRTVTVREIVPGSYAGVNVAGTYQQSRACVRFDAFIEGASASELRAAAQVFEAIADALPTPSYRDIANDPHRVCETDAARSN